MALEASELKAALEALIFVASEPLTRQALAGLFPEEEAAALDRALAELTADHAVDGRGLVLAQVAGGWRISTRPEVHAHVQRLVQMERAERLSLRTLETLSVIAYKQPVTAAEVQEIRGVDPSGTLKTLLDKGLVTVVGRKKVVGRPFVYGTTRAFLTTFGLSDLSELPSLKELEDIGVDFTPPDPSEIELPDERNPAGDDEQAEGGADAGRDP
jgi:segregation and condensation protein B